MMRHILILLLAYFGMSVLVKKSAYDEYSACCWSPQREALGAHPFLNDYIYSHAFLNDGSYEY